MIGYNEGEKINFFWIYFFLSKKSWELMNLNATNMKHTDSFCPICKSSDFTLYDEYHGETFCATCGLILHRQSNHKSAVDYINEVKNNESNFRNYLNRQFLRSDE